MWIEWNRPGQCVDSVEQARAVCGQRGKDYFILAKLNLNLSFANDRDICTWFATNVPWNRSSFIIKLILWYLSTHWCSMPGCAVCFVCCCTGGYYTFICKMTFMPEFLIVFALCPHLANFVLWSIEGKHWVIIVRGSGCCDWWLNW